MKSEDVLMLVRAGYSRDEIDKLYNENPGTSGAGGEEPEKPTEKETPEPESNPPKEDDSRIAQLEAAIKSLTETIQRGNIGNRGIDTKPTLTAEEALGSLISKNTKKE